MAQEQNERQTLQQFVAAHKVTATAGLTDRNPNMDTDPRHPMTHYKVRLRAGRRSMTLHFSMGMAHTREPEVADVLDCLASDSASFENARSFEDWCSDYGYDTDSRKAERTYRAIQRQAGKLQRVLGEDAYQALLWNTER